MVKLGVDGALRLIEEGVLVNQDIDHFLLPLFVASFSAQDRDLLVMSGANIPEAMVHESLHQGNTGAAPFSHARTNFCRAGRADGG